jgi:hypothetical protein
MGMATHTKDIGAAIQSALEVLDTVETRDWDTPDQDVTGDFAGDELVIDASYGFDDLRIAAPDGALFRVIITRVG